MSVRLKKKKNFIHENPFSCAVCRKAFARKVGLRAHLYKTKHSVAKQWPLFLKTVLPQEWSYSIISFSKNGSHYKVKCVLPSVVTVADLRSWIESFIDLSQCVYIRVGRKKNRSGLTPYSEFYRCQHFHPKKNGKKRTKGTGCKSSITASIKCDFSSDPYYSIVCINFLHNHPVYSGETLKYRKPSIEVEKVFRRMLEDNFNPAHALRNFMIHLEFQPANLYINSIGDRTKCPDYNWVHHFCRKLFKKTKLEINNAENILNLKKEVENINEEFTAEACCFQELSNNDYVLSILTPLMKRGLECSVAGEIIFIDSIDCTDKFGVNIILLSCIYNPTTRIPLGIVITSEESISVVERGFKLYLTMINRASFGNRGTDGPAVIMSDYSKVKVKVLKNMFPKAAQLWVSYYFLKSVYSWLLNSKYHVNKDDLSHLYRDIRKLVYSPDEDMLESQYHEMLQINSHNPHLLSYLKNIYEKRHKWALCFRSLLPRQNIRCKKVLELEVQILREEILDRVKALSPNALLRYFVTNYDNYYMRKLMDNSMDINQNYFNKYLNDMDADCYTFGPFLESDSLYYVFNKNKKTKYIVNADICMCTCYIGVGGNFCRHQRILMNALNEEPMMQYPIIVEPKVPLYYIATGSNEISQTFFDSFQTINNVENDIQYAMEVVLKNDGTSVSSCLDNIEENLDTHVVEEILIEVKDENIIDPDEDVVNIDLNQVPVVGNNAADRFINENLTDNLRQCFHSFVAKLQENVEFYDPGIRAMCEELKKVNKGSAHVRLLALHSFNKYS